MPSTTESGGAAAARAGPKKWEFVNVNKPKRHQDKEVTSLVRAHATRSVRRRQRLELTAQYQREVKATEPQYDQGDSRVVAKPSIEMNLSDWMIVDKVDDNYLVAVHEMLSGFEPVSLDLLASENGASCATERDGNVLVQRPNSWQSCEEDKIQAFYSQMLRAHSVGSPQSLVGDGVFDPFNALPIPGWTSHKGHVLKHFVNVVGLHCVPANQRKGQNALTKIWLPYFLQDVTLFLAILMFAEVLLEIMSGNYNSERSLLRKCDLINAINMKLRDGEHALSNETIGAVAMLAAVEGVVGNYKELRVHMNGLQKMVFMRGGLQSLGWGGILHTFISWQDLFSSALTTSAPRHDPTPYCQLVRGSLPHSDPVFSGLDFSTDFCIDIASCFQNMRHLTEMINYSHGPQTTTAAEQMSFSEIRANTVKSLLSLADTKPPPEMTNLDYNIEICRLAALIYIRVALQKDKPACATVRIVKHRLMLLIKQGETRCTIAVGARQQPPSITWALFVSGSVSLNGEEREWFAQRLAKGVRALGVDAWPVMEECLARICWSERLNTSMCRDLWGKIVAINEGYVVV